MQNPQSQSINLNFNYAAQNKSQLKQVQAGKRCLYINQRFILKSNLNINSFYKAYKGIDVNSKKYVIIYIKPSCKQKLFSKNIKEELRQKIAPPLRWVGTQKIDKNFYDIEVYSKYGPSLNEIMQNYRKKISEKTFYLLAYHLLKLIDKIDIAGYVMRSLNPKIIICSQSHLKNDLYLINPFDLERKNQESLTITDFRYCSVGTHLKLKTCSKDTVESMCYILMDFYLKGNLYGNINNQNEKQLLQAKTTFKPEGIPILFLQFFQYVRYLNNGEQIKFTQWKMKFKKILSQNQFSKPYEWVQNKSKSQQGSMKTENIKIAQDNSIRSSFPLSNVNQKMEQQIEQQELQFQEDKDELEEGETYASLEMSSKILSTNSQTLRRY